MDFFQHRYYKVNKILMTLIGQWPYQSIGARRGIVFVILSLGGIQLTPLLMALVKYGGDRRILLDGTLVLLFGAVSLTKLIGFMLNSKKTLKLLNRIRTDWHEWAKDQEVDILHRYAEQQRKTIVAYLVMNFTNHSVFMAQPTIPKIIDLFLKNGTEPGTFPYPVAFYHVDVQKYYFYINTFLFVCVSTVTMVVATNGVMLICYVQHVCGIFAALGYVNLIAASYAWTFFFTIGFGMILFIIVGLQILMRTNDPESSIRYIVFVLSVTLYFYIDCYVSENVTEHSINIYFYIHNSQWYKLSLEAQKLLQFMTMRCSVTCQLTAGKMLVMSRRNFGQTLKTSISYLTLVRSMQGL